MDSHELGLPLRNAARGPQAGNPSGGLLRLAHRSGDSQIGLTILPDCGF